MTTTQTIKLNKTAPMIGLVKDVEREILDEACFGEKSIQAENLNFEVYVMAFADTPDRKVDKISPKSIKLVDKECFIKYESKWFPLQSIPANSCDMRTRLPAIIVGCQR